MSFITKVVNLKANHNLKLGHAVRVFWYDSASHGGWQYSTKIGDVGKIVTLGYVLNTKPNCITVSSSIATDNASIDPISIPWGSILKIDRIKEFDRNNISS